MMRYTFTSINPGTTPSGARIYHLSPSLITTVTSALHNSPSSYAFLKTVFFLRSRTLQPSLKTYLMDVMCLQISLL